MSQNRYSVHYIAFQTDTVKDGARYASRSHGLVVVKDVTSPNDEEWEAVSGGAGWGSIEIGEYEITEVVKMADLKENSAYKKEGFPWYARLKPRFRSRRTNMLIHGEGGVPDITLGCVGISSFDISLYTKLNEIIKSGPIAFEVI